MVETRNGRGELIRDHETQLPIMKATKCDLCLGRPEGPACVQMCPHGSAKRISFKDLEQVTSTLR